MTQEESHILLPEEKTYAREYKWRHWWIEHRFTLKQTGLLVVMAAEVLLLLFVVWNLSDAFLLSSSGDEQAVAQMVTSGSSETHAFAISQQAESLQLSGARVLSLGDSRYDFYAEVTNPNDHWWAEVDYVFSSGEIREKGTEFVLPSGETPLVAFFITSSIPLTSVSIEIQEVRWHRLDVHTIPVYEEWQEDHFRLAVTDISFDPSFELNGKRIGRMTFTITNEGPYGFYEVPLYLLLFRGGSVVGVNRTEVSTLDAGETKQVVVNWFGVVPSVSTYEVIPLINLFDPEVYQELQGKQSIDARVSF
ncbi:TPA: hypothetical protein DEP34_01810 [Candidatus Uhrbacteria bacterium]|uniref:Uncharacterized protein n=2 Tax=Candidatus Uhriibacteriota TaxID=1752732 RepID=A0A0G1SF44_9BACT|nr:MAG: hypothetical protein UX45_C0011G0027 [Candidatus Uhrbacteria bacterium GW2011_GWF2_46_218]KKU40678.1 MAG: hypothetical protein UX57_C0012G0027 [Candidatus Uhrbacteria bacterium GW2011_GWE2_46_68]HBK34335.1 hypothetical protein [Candidatus Uhrbacteria bacterium]HCB19105.1 hypothetical protein [Candidatus Uhrbacteria bacterium]